MSAPLSLYRHILRLHRSCLPASLRVLGDEYVKVEFRRHKNASPEFVVGFMEEWRSYADTLAKDNNYEPWRDLSPDELSEEQHLQLLTLRQEAEMINLREELKKP